jgi:hypothetical protein
MGLKRYRKKASNFFSGVGDHLQKGVKSAGDFTQRAGDQAQEGYRRYKDPIIIGSATALGAVLGSLLMPGVGTVAGGMLGASLAGGTAGTARGMYTANKAAKEQKDAIKNSGNYFSGVGRRIAGRTRQGGEGDVSYSTYEEAV